MKRIILMSIGLLFFTTTSCKKEDLNTEKEQTKLENENPAQNNAEIISQSLLQEVEKILFTQEYEGEIYALGTSKGSTSLMRLTPNGEMIWKQHIPLNDYRRLRVFREGILVLTNHDSDGDGKNDRAKIFVYNRQGTYLSEYVVKDTNYDTIINDVIIQENKVFVGGMVVKNDIDYPYVQELFFKNGELENYRLTSSQGGSSQGGSLSKGSVSSLENPSSGNQDQSVTIPSGTVASPGGVVFTRVKGFYIYMELPKQYIVNLSYHNDNLYFTTNEYKQTIDDDWNTNIVKINALSKSIVWQQKIVPDNPQHKLETTHSNIVIKNNEIFFIANTEDDKQPAPNDGGYWKSGMLIKVIDNGNNGFMVWKKKMSLSNNGERFYNITQFNNNLYIVGTHSWYAKNNNDFANGLIVKTDTEGNILYTKTFGDSTKNNWLFTSIILNGQLLSFGASNQNAWIIKTAL